jgi:hypothetical protein
MLDVDLMKRNFQVLGDYMISRCVICFVCANCSKPQKGPKKCSFHADYSDDPLRWAHPSRFPGSYRCFSETMLSEKKTS